MRKWLKQFSPLGWRLVVATVAFSTVVALLMTAIQLYRDYRLDLGTLDSTLDQIGTSYLPTISNALWATNRKELQVALDGLSRISDVRYVKAFEKDVVWGEAGRVKTENIRSRTYALTYLHRGEKMTIGTLDVVMDLDGVYQRLLNKFWVILITNGIKAFFVAGFMLWLFHWLVTRHLYRVAEFASRLSTENLQERLVLDRPPHISGQIDEFDLVVDGLGRMQSNLAQAVQALEQDIVKLEKAENEILLLNTALEQRVAERTAQLEAVNRELEAFSYSVSHDLRTPLRGIDGFSQALAEDYGAHLDEVGHDYLKRIRHAAQRMGVLIDDLLQLARVTRTEMKRVPIDLSNLAREAIADLHKHKGCSEDLFDVQAGLATAGDPALLRIVMENLLDNAWKYSSKVAQAKVQFGCMDENGKTVFFVRDNGVGFDMAYVGKLFGAFQRLHRAEEFPGTGVGLATVKRIVHRHGGEIWAEGMPGQGAIFRFTLTG